MEPGDLAALARGKDEFMDMGLASQLLAKPLEESVNSFAGFVTTLKPL